MSENVMSPEEEKLAKEIEAIKADLEAAKQKITDSGIPMSRKITLREDIDLIEEQLDQE